MEEKKLYWQIENNADLSVTCNNEKECLDIMIGDYADLDLEDQHSTYYTITPVWYTDKEYLELDEI